MKVKYQPEELYILSRAHPRPRPACRQKDSRQPVFCCHLRPQPSPASVPPVMTTCQLTILQLSPLQALHCLQGTGHQVQKHSMQDSPGSGPCPGSSSGSCVALGLQSPVPQTYRTSPTLLEKPAFLISPLSTCQNPKQLKGAPLKGQFPIFPAGEPSQL